MNYINVTDGGSIYNNYAKCEHDEYDAINQKYNIENIYHEDCEKKKSRRRKEREREREREGERETLGN